MDHQDHNSREARRQPDKVLTIEGTSVSLFAPAPRSESEHEALQGAIVRAAAECLKSAIQAEESHEQ